MIAYLKLSSAAEWAALYRQHFAVEVNGEWVPRQGVQVDELGTIQHIEGPVQGWHVNVIAPDIPEAVHPHLVNPQQPKRVYFGAEVLTLPEPLPEAGGVALISRSVGQSVPDDVIARVERTVLERRLVGEQVPNRIARLRATLAVLEAREAAGRARGNRDDALVAVDVARVARDAAVAARTALVEARDAQQAIRADAIARLATLTGAARAPEVARRDAAVAEIARLTPLLDAATAQQQARAADLAAASTALQGARDAVDAANAAIAAARAARDAISI